MPKCLPAYAQRELLLLFILQSLITVCKDGTVGRLHVRGIIYCSKLEKLKTLNFN